MLRLPAAVLRGSSLPSSRRVALHLNVSCFHLMAGQCSLRQAGAFRILVHLSYSGNSSRHLSILITVVPLMENLSRSLSPAQRLSP
jgi:hypothetical protein